MINIEFWKKGYMYEDTLFSLECYDSAVEIRHDIWRMCVIADVLNWVMHPTNLETWISQNLFLNFLWYKSNDGYLKVI